MPTLSQLVLPVKNTTTGEVTNIAYDLPSGGGSGASNPESIGIGYGICESTGLAKTVTISGFSLKKNGMVAVRFLEDVDEGSTLNVSLTGAKAIFYRGVAIIDNLIHAGDTVVLSYDGTNFNVVSVDRLFRAKVEITGDANAVVEVTNTTFDIYDLVQLDSNGEGTYEVNIPGTYVFDNYED